MKIKLIFFYFLAVSIIFLSCSAKTPVISAIDPKIGNMGEIITLTGINFGSSRGESYVTIAGVSPTSSSYFLWQDNMILVRVPELGDSGLVYVHVKGKKSNAVLFSNSASVPRPIEGADMGLEPRITAVNPQMGIPGSLINITGNNFGISRGNSLQSMSGVFFSWDYESPSFNPYVIREPEYIEVSEIEFGYELWSARELRVRVPDGAVGGNLIIRTPNGVSRPVYFEVSGKPGYKNLKERRSYVISYSVDIRVQDATRPNTLYLWIPIPVSSSSQRNVSLVSRNIEPSVENHRGVSLFKLDNLGSGASRSVNLTYQVDVYSIESGVRVSPIRQERTPLFVQYTQSSPLIPSDNQQIRNTVNSIVGREQNPHAKAKLIYDWILANINISGTPSAPESNIAALLERRNTDSYGAALLFTAMARAALVPAIPSAGILIDRNGQTFRHYWAEFWIDGLGWLPVDPAMGSGVITSVDSAAVNFASFYFGNLDYHRITFSRGEVALSQMENRGRMVSNKQSYSLQNIWEEAVGGLESYTSLWGDITISGIYQ
ncbi:MAG: IPT/TIG domain-containing protein [Treponema sp.]|nr:IPT/TIG domain-containing protein [Treponema sp.]